MMSFVKRFLAIFLFLMVLSSNAEASDGNLRIGVAKFASRAAGISDEHAAIITDLFTFELVQSKGINVIERDSIDRIGEELRFNMSGLVDPMTAAEIGKIAGLQYMLLGAITQVDQRASGGGFSLFAMSSREMTATVDMRVVDVQTAQITMALRAEGTSKNESHGMSWGGFSFVETQFGGLEARAIADAVTKLSAEVRKTLGGEYSYVVSTTSDGFAIDVAAPRVGALYLVYQDGRTIFDLDGDIIGTEKLPLAVLKVSEVNVGHSIAKIVPQGGSADNVRRGDKIDPISAAQAKELAGKLPKERPRASSSNTAELLFGGGGGGAESRNTAGGGPVAPQRRTISDEPETTSDPDEMSPDSTPAISEAQVTPTPPRPSAAAPVEANQQQTEAAAGFDPNTSTDAKVIDTLPLSPGERNIVGIKHRNAFNLYSARRYEEAFLIFAELAAEYNSNYLSAYWAGMASLRLNENQEAAEWFDYALEINPRYQPARDEREKL